MNTIGFIDERAQFLWSLFNMISLALLAVFEAAAFFSVDQRAFLGAPEEVFLGIAYSTL